MKRTVAGVSVLLLAAGANGVARMEQSQREPRVSSASPSQVSAIMVDVVVRNRKGEPVSDLTQEDFELYEDGVEQHIGSFTPVFLRSPAGPAPERAQTEAPGTGAQTPPPATAAPQLSAIARAPEVIALVFDRLTADSRTLAYTAAMKYLGEQPVSNNYIAVYGIDVHLMPYQNFTRDTALIRKAIDAFAAHSSSQYGSSREARREQDQNANGSADAAARLQEVTAAGGPAAGAAAQVGAAAAQQQFEEMQASMTQTFEALERDQAGYATSNALLAVVNGMRSIPGRKSIVFFSEGLSIPPNVYEQFRSVVDAANRANVSIYPMDAMGLRAESTTSQTRDEMLNTAKQALNRPPGVERAGPSKLAALERNEDLLHMDPNSGLGDLADGTGGILISNTNDLRAGFSRIESDMRNYYLLTYVPKNDTFDGRFREISVKVKRGGLSVHARKGYYAVREAPGIPVRTYEAPALAALDRTPVPNAFPVRASVLTFPERDHPQMLSVIVELPTSVIAFEPAEDKKTYRSDFTVVVRFTGAAEQVVDKMSQRYELTGPIEKMADATNGQVIFYRQAELPPGLYTMQTAVYDAVSKKASVRFTTIEQPNQDVSALRMSSLVLVRRGEHVNDTETGNPLYVGNTLLYPNLTGALKKDVDKDLAFYFTAYADSTSGPQLSGAVELLRNASVLARVPMQLSAADPSGRVQQFSRVPITALEPGSYQLRVFVTQGNKTVSRSAEFRIVS
jgi:VWFA-related protein